MSDTDIPRPPQGSQEVQRVSHEIEDTERVIDAMADELRNQLGSGMVSEEGAREIAEAQLLRIGTNAAAQAAADL